MLTRSTGTMLCLTTMMLTLFCIEFSRAGMNYVDDGFGLHPALAFPLACLCVCTIVAHWIWVMYDSQMMLVEAIRAAVKKA